jgi:hypothetical protein
LQRAKTLVLFPFEIYDVKNAAKIKINDNSAVIYVGDLLGPRLDLQSDLFLPTCISEIVGKRSLTLGVGEIFYPVFAPDAVRLLIKWLFSFGPYGKELLLIGPDMSETTFFEKNKRLVGEISMKIDKSMENRVLPRGIEIQRLNRDPAFSLSETYGWLSQNWHKYVNSGKILKRSKMPVHRFNVRVSRRIKTAVLLLLLVLIFPFLTLSIFAGMSFVAYKEFLSGKDDVARNTILIAETIVVTGGEESKVLSYIPVVGRLYKETDYGASLSKDLSLAAENAVPVVRNTTSLFNNMLGDQAYDPTAVSLSLGTNLSNLYDNILLLQKTTQIAASENVVLAKNVLSRVDFEKYKNLVSQGKILASRVPEILGENQSKTYLVLFENNMELRPTGGFIGSYGLLTFDSGRLSDLTVNDVYSADGQLNGHVEPPAPIKNYLGEANWWLRDSNWDPDFPTSAQRAEWFLDKEIGKQVDGVVAIDLEPIKEILKYTGPVFLSDYDLDISTDNLYEETQAEVQDNFFPGTHQKASFLTGLSQTLLGELGKLDSQQKMSVLQVFYTALEGRHVQAFLHDTESQNALNLLGWDGSVNTPSCGQTCYADLAGLVEANLGVNKADYFIQRSMTLSVNVGSYEIDRTLELNLKNTANVGFGPSGIYKDYIRVIVPDDATAIGAESISGQDQESLPVDVTEENGIKEIGVWVTVLEGDEKSIAFEWKSQLQANSPVTSYGLYLRKQAGVGDVPVTLNIKLPGVTSNTDPRFSLTQDGSYLYNTTLTQDLFSSFSW